RATGRYFLWWQALQPDMAHCHQAAADTAEAGKGGVNALPEGGRVVQEGEQEEDAGDGYANALEDAQRARLQAIDMLEVERSDHRAKADQEATEVDQARGQQGIQCGHGALQAALSAGKIGSEIVFERDLRFKFQRLVFTQGVGGDRFKARARDVIQWPRTEMIAVRQ